MANLNNQSIPVEYWLSQMQRVAAVGYYIFDLFSESWYASPELSEVLGMGEDYPKTLQSWANLIHPEDREELVKYYQDRIATKTDFHIVYRVVRPNDGKVIWVHGKGVVQSNDKGEPIGVFGTIQDITERYNTQRALLISEEKYRSIFDTVPMGLIHYDTTGQVTISNSDAQKLLHMSGKELESKCIKELPIDGIGLAYKYAVDSKSGVFESLLIGGMNNDVSPLRITLSQITVTGVAQGGICIIEDLTERKQIERLFFHDVLNSASNLRNLVEMLEEEKEAGEDIDDIIRTMKSQAERVINELQAHKHLVQNDFHSTNINAIELNAANFLDELIESFRGSEIAEGKFIEKDITMNNRRFISDPILIGRVLTNLIKNALEASQNNDTVTVTATDTEERVIFSVHNSTTIADEVIGKMFKPNISTKGFGRGIGTHSVKFITERYLKGLVSFSSNKESGTTFTVDYPRKLKV